MDQSILKAYEAKCTQDAPPACRSNCPLHVDVRQFAIHMQSGAWGKARVLLDKALPFAPLLTALCDHPCEDACVRSQLGGPVAIGDLERTCVAFSKEHAARPAMLPAKNKRVAVLGSGIAGLAAAWELALKGFGVTLHFPGGNPEEHLLLEFRSVELAKGLDLGCLVRDALNTLESMKVDFTVLEFSENIGAASAFKNDFDGVFVDAACFSALAPGESAVDPMTGMHNGDREACGGYASSATMQAFEGKRGAVSLTRAMTGASPSALREQEGPYASRLHADASGHERKDRIRPAQGLFTAGEAQEEASRCISCECMRCVKECAYLRQYGEYPKVYARQMFLNLGIYTGYRRLNSQINSCALCGQCDEICPERFSMADFCLLLREEMVRQRKMPPSAHHFALQEFSASAYEASVLALGGREETSCSGVFFPGCQLAAARPAQVRFVFRHLCQNLPGTTGIWLNCCGIPAHFAGRADMVDKHKGDLKKQWTSLGSPEVIVACASCLRFFKEQLPEIPVRSLWETLDREAQLPKLFQSDFSDSGDEEGGCLCSLHDPCSARNDEKWLASVRNLLRKAEVPFAEPATTGRTTACCGYGGLVWNANPEMSAIMAKDRADKLPGTAMTSCIMCREQLISAGRPSWHLLDILVPPEPVLANWLDENGPDVDVRNAYASCAQLSASDLRIALRPESQGPGFSQRRVNRAQLKQTFRIAEYQLEPDAEAILDLPNLQIHDGVLEDLERKHILLQDIANTVEEAEKNGTIFRDRKNGCLLARHRSGPVTFWVRYAKDDIGCNILDAYMHRMDIVPVS